MGAAQRRKGARAEREVVTLLRAFGLQAQRVSPLEAGGADFGDVRDSQGHVWQVKRRKASGLYAWLEGCTRLAVRADGHPWIVVLPMEEYLRLAGPGQTEEHGGADK